MRYLIVAAMAALFAANPALADSCDGVRGLDGRPLTGTACEEYVALKYKLDQAMTDIDLLETALQMYYQLEGVFPGKAGTLVQGVKGDVPAGSTWSELGFTFNPLLTPQIASISYVPFRVHPPAKAGGIATAESFALIVTLKNFKPNTIDGQLVGVSPSQGLAITGPASASAAPGKVQGDDKKTWRYTCHQATTQPVDPIVRMYFNNAGAAMVCK